MAWFNESLSSWKGQLTNFTKEVLADVREDKNVLPGESDVEWYQQKIRELETKCSFQEEEITRLKDESVQLHKRLGEHEIPLNESCPGSPDQVEHDWLSSWDYIQTKQDQYGTSSQGFDDDGLGNGRQMVQKDAQEEERYKNTCIELKAQVEKLNDQLKSSEEFKVKWQDSERRVCELEIELHSVQQQLLQQISNSQANVSEIREGLQNTRQNLSYDADTENFTNQDVLNQIIQAKEKNKMTENNVLRLQRDGQEISDDLFDVVKNLGDSEQQEILCGSLKALQIENQVLKLRNANLEHLQKYEKVDEGSSVTESSTLPHANEYSDNGSLKLDDELNISALSSDVMELRRLREELLVQVSLLQSQVKEEEKQNKDRLKAENSTLVEELQNELLALKKENQCLISSLEELDQQHQTAIEKVLSLNTALKTEVETLKKKLEKPETVNVCVETLPDTQVSDNVKYEDELYEDLIKLVTFEVPKEYFTSSDHGKVLTFVEALAKMTSECKWQRATLERKVSEITKEVRDLKQENENLRTNLLLLEDEMGMNQSITETLPSIPENNEEVEILEHKVMTLEKEAKESQSVRLGLENEMKDLRHEISDANTKLKLSEEFVKSKEKECVEILSQLTDVKDQLERNKNNLKEAMDEENKAKELSDAKYNLEVQVRDLKQEISEAIGKLKLSEELIKSKENRFNEIMTQLSNITEQLNNSERNFKELMNEKLILENEVKELQEAKLNIESLKQEISDAHSKLEIQDELIRNKESEYIKLMSESAVVKEQLKNCENSSKEAIDAKLIMEKEISNIKQELEAAQQVLDNYRVGSVSKEDFNTLSEKYFLLQSKITELKNVSCLKEQELQAELMSVNECLGKKETDFVEIQLLYVDLQFKFCTEINEVECRLKERDSELGTLQKQFSDLKVTCHNLEDELRIRATTVAELQEILQKKEQESADLMNEWISKLNVVNKKYESKCDELKVLEKNLVETVNEKAELYTCNEKLQNDYRSIQDEISNKELQHQKEIKNLKSEIDSKESKLIALEALNGKMEQDILDSKSMYENNEIILNALRVECERLQSIEKKHLEEISSLHETADLYHSHMKDEIRGRPCLEEKHKMLVEFEGKESIQNVVKEDNVDIRKEGIGEVKEIDESEIKEEVVKELESIMKNTGEDILEAVEAKLQSLILEKYQHRISMKEKCNDSNRLLRLLADEKAMVEKLKKDNDTFLKSQQFYNEESSQMSKETISNLSQIIKDKDAEIRMLTEKCAQIEREIKSKCEGSRNSEKEISKVQIERDELIHTLQLKHVENVQYHEEIQRLSMLLSQELNKSEECQLRHKGLVQQFEDKQKLLINTQNELIAVKQRLEKLEEKARNHEALHVFGNNFNVDQLFAKDVECHENNQLTEMKESERKTNQEAEILKAQVIELQLQLQSSVKMPNNITEKEMQQLKDSLFQEQTKNMLLQNEVEAQRERGNSLLKELERLRHHLLKVEENYTAEALRMEEQVKELQSKLSQAEERIKNSSTAYTSVSILANQQVESLQEQYRLVCLQRDEVQQKLSFSEDQIQKHMISLRNLQAVLEQFQKDKDQDIRTVSEKMNLQLRASQTKQDELATEIMSLKRQLAEAKEGLSAAKRLGEQLEKKNEIITSMKDEVSKLSLQLSEMEKKVLIVQEDTIDKIDKSLAKNLIIGYCMAPPNRKTEVLRVMGTVLDFTQEDRNKVGLEGQSTGGGRWFQTLLQPVRDAPQNTTSLSEAFIRFLENESRPQPQLQLLPDTNSLLTDASRERKTSTSSTRSDSSQVRQSPLLLSSMELPTFTQVSVGRNSSSILKDVLKS